MIQTIHTQLGLMLCIIRTSHKCDVNERAQMDEELLHLRRDNLLSEPLLSLLADAL